MGIDFENFRLLLVITLISVIGFIILLRAYVYISEKFFLNQFTWLLQNTIFRSYLAFKYSVYSLLLIYTSIGISSIILEQQKLLGLFILVLVSYSIYYIHKSKKEGKLRIREDFEFQRYSTPVSYYNKQTEEYRRKSFESIIDKIKRTKFAVITNETYRNYLFQKFVSKIDQLLSFEYYDAKLNHSISKHSTATLFYQKFLKNVLEILSRINNRTKDLELVGFDYQRVTDLLLNIKLVDFDDLQGYHYNIKSLDDEIDKILKEKFEDSKLNNYKHLLKFQHNSKKIYPLFERYLNLRYKDDDRLQNLEIQFIKFVTFFCNEKIYEVPSINSFEVKDVKYLIGFFSYLNGKNIANYKVSDLVFLILKISGNEAEGNNSSFEQAHRNSDFKLSEIDEKSINSVYNRLFTNKK